MVTPAQTVVTDRIAWAIETSCPRCGAVEEQCGWDEMPDPWREVLLAEEGRSRLRADRERNRPVKVRLLAVLRRQGATIPEALGTYDALTGEGVTGTSAEMTLLATRLSNAGAIVTLALA
ncbi:hypothetical protein [Actinoplanes sp. NBRC 101535]|uniref:hypothetical protein n=1 Tax=Actinoplanes sp. NBRC 101535 TaxID=3032196 RepID=UPI0024A0639F|nr:hypothetical protein [Actinoplanes sp. NBRC 101535]GLY05564.1 hypothetical protein Acsp01_59430 [Actinoplanes sp. NBRC 101535]